MEKELYMQKALELALKGWPDVAPNPMVGCVIVLNDKIIAEGYHEYFGGPHAEVKAINNFPQGINPSECTVYVTLEPCSHFGKTPPCADLIIEKGFKKVVICNLDPNPLVAGKGVQKLRDAGVEVISGVLEDEGRKLNKRFFVFHEKKRPYIILKWAETADGFISRFPVPENRNENIISTPEQMLEVHKMRASEMAIMVGKNTVLWDNPSLTTRLVEGKNPVRIVIDRQLDIPRSFNVYNRDSQTLVLNYKKEGVEDNITFCKLDFAASLPEQICALLHEKNIQSVIIEGGAFLLESFFEKELFDEVKIYKNDELIFGSGIKAPRRR